MGNGEWLFVSVLVILLCFVSYLVNIDQQNRNKLVELCAQKGGIYQNVWSEHARQHIWQCVGGTNG